MPLPLPNRTRLYTHTCISKSLSRSVCWSVGPSITLLTFLPESHINCLFQNTKKIWAAETNQIKIALRGTFGRQKRRVLTTPEMVLLKEPKRVFCILGTRFFFAFFAHDSKQGGEVHRTPYYHTIMITITMCKYPDSAVQCSAVRCNLPM